MMQTAEIYSAEVSIEKQLLRLYSSNNYCKEYRVSTSRFGIGHELNSFKTPTGKFEIEQKIGAGEPLDNCRLLLSNLPEINQLN